MSYLTEAEVEAIQHLGRDTPYCISNASMSQFSVARHFGACTFNGHSYTYMATSDELIRDDVLRFVTKMRKGK